MEALSIVTRLAIVFPSAGVILFVCAVLVSAGIGIGSWLISNIPLMLDKWTGFGEKKRKEAEEIYEAFEAWNKRVQQTQLRQELLKKSHENKRKH